MKCKKDELKLKSNEGKNVCVKNNIFIKAGKNYGDGYSGFDYGGVEKEFVEKCFVKDDEPNMDFYECLDDLWMGEPPPDYESVNYIRKEIAEENDLDLESLENNDDVRYLIEEGFNEGYDMVDDLIKNIRGRDVVIGIYLPLQEFDGGAVVRMELDEYVKEVVDSMKGAKDKEEFFKNFTDNILKKSRDIDIVDSPDFGEAKKITNTPPIEYLRKIIKIDRPEYVGVWEEME